MVTARIQQVNLSDKHYQHCSSCSISRAFLCGEGNLTGESSGGAFIYVLFYYMYLQYKHLEDDRFTVMTLLLAINFKCSCREG
jgi:hypothetical protein